MDFILGDMELFGTVFSMADDDMVDEFLLAGVDMATDPDFVFGVGGSARIFVIPAGEPTDDGRTGGDFGDYLFLHLVTRLLFVPTMDSRRDSDAHEQCVGGRWELARTLRSGHWINAVLSGTIRMGLRGLPCHAARTGTTSGACAGSSPGGRILARAHASAAP